MTISPCAMLMTPITPKVMARPMAASNRTEPSESPYQAFCTAAQSARSFSIEAMASAAAFLTAGEALAGSPASSPSDVLIAALPDHRYCVDLLGIGRIVEIEDHRGPRLDQRLLHPGVGLPARSPGRAAASAFASLDLKTAWAASRRLAGSGAISVKLPSAASMIRRRRLLSRTGERSAGASPATGCPVAASSRRSELSRMKTRLLCAPNSSRPSCRAPNYRNRERIAAGGYCR